jgi:NAD(P)-dependent dehydrogenase (short-subunit alcohol dehydrogenase family)
VAAARRRDCSHLGSHGRDAGHDKKSGARTRAVRVNLIAAGFVDTPLSASILGNQLDTRREQLRTTLPIRRVVGPADVAALAVHIMTNTALTGATFDIDGGQQLVEG